MTTLYVRKLVSLNPIEYRDEPLQIMLKDYHRYILCFIYWSGEIHKKVPKTFDNWLTTEI